MKKYCTYITLYIGDKLPPYYIGSTSIEKVHNGYNGSVSSKKYKEIYQKEQKENKHLFQTIIMKTFYKRKMSVVAEGTIQKQLNVVKSELYFNMSIARKNGFCGMDNSGKNHHGYGKPSGNTGTTRSDEWKENHSDMQKEYWKDKEHHLKGTISPRKGLTDFHSDKTKKQMSDSALNRPPKSEETKQKTRDWIKENGHPKGMLNKHHSEATKKKMSEATKGIKKPQKTVTCPHCDLSGGQSNMTRWHFDNCKHRRML